MTAMPFKRTVATHHLYLVIPITESLSNPVQFGFSCHSSKAALNGTITYLTDLKLFTLSHLTYLQDLPLLRTQDSGI
jgi:hypothetical protein